MNKTLENVRDALDFYAQYKENGWSIRAEQALSELEAYMENDVTVDVSPVLLSDEWLGNVGFKYTQEDRQPTKHWRLNLGWGAPNTSACIDDLCIEVASCAMDGKWFCWLRGGTRFSNKFIHIRYIKYRHEIEEIITALTGTKWKPENSMYGNFYNDKIAAKLRCEYERITPPKQTERNGDD